jgi:hypothetical protein
MIPSTKKTEQKINTLQNFYLKLALFLLLKKRKAPRVHCFTGAV